MDEGLEEEGHPGLEEKHERGLQRHERERGDGEWRGFGVDGGQETSVGDEVRRGRQVGRSVVLGSKGSALFATTVHT